MIPRRIQLENFLGFGSPAQELVFSDTDFLWVISGPNGIGKSSIFDAITYALFEQHRGGAQKHTSLIHHGADSFNITFEFEYEGEVYRIYRSRRKTGRQVQTVERWLNNEQNWEMLDAPDVSEWVQKTLGLNHEAFSLSVLLKQGESDKFLNSKGRERLELLKTLIELEPLQKLYDTVNSKYKSWVDKHDTTVTTLKSLQPVTEKDLENIAAEIDDAKDRKAKAKQSIDSLQSTIQEAKDFQKVALEIADFERKLKDAAEAEKDRVRIETDFDRYEKLRNVVPTIQTLIKLTSEYDVVGESVLVLEKEETELEASVKKLELEKLEADSLSQNQVNLLREANQALESLQQGLKNDRLWFKYSRDKDALIEQEASYPADLVEQSKAADAEKEQWVKQHQDAEVALGVLQGKLKDLKKEEADFNKVKTGVKCSRCNQLVTKEHAEREKEELKSRIAAEQEELSKVTAKLEQLHPKVLNATEQVKDIQAKVTKRNEIRLNLDNARKNLADQGVSLSTEELKSTLTSHEQEIEQRTKSLAIIKEENESLRIQSDKVKKEWEATRKRHATVHQDLQKVRLQRTGIQSTQATHLSHLPDEWKAPLPDAAQCSELKKELDGFATSDIENQYKRCRQFANSKSTWQQLLDTKREEAKKFSEQAKQPIDKIQSNLNAVKHEMAQIETAITSLTTSQLKLQDIHRQYQQQEKLLAEAEKASRLHGKLVELLGAKNLQRDLVRSAEEDLVSLANQTLSRITHHGMTLSLKEAGESDKALALEVQKAGSTFPIGTEYLSGSEKFRVSVAIALAIGRYASGRNKPLESVIIDEGFGCLDRDGLSCMAKELRNLQSTEALKRIILVSHQEEFVGHFDVRYNLSRGDNGTVATRHMI